MKVFNCIFGILSIIGAIYCMFYPGLTFLNAGWIVTILLGVWGICSVIDYFAKRKKAKAEQSEAIMGTLGLVVGIAAAVISILAMFMPSIRLMFDVIILCIFSGWLVVDGISSVAMSFKVKKSIFLRCMAYSAFLRNTRHNRRYLRIFPPYICRTDNRIYDWCPFVNLRCKAYSFGI